MPDHGTKVVSQDRLLEIRRELRSQARAVVQCHGCFDIVHPGHIRYLRFAKEQGDVLVVSVSGDDVVAKGFDRPYINETLRAENLAALEFVDWVCIDHHDWGGPILEAVKPDVYVKGKEYETNADPRFLKEREIVQASGGRVIFSSGDVVFSSSTIINQFRKKFSLEQQKIDFFCQRNGIKLAILQDLLTKMSQVKVLVVGDPILDHYIHCEAPEIAAEAPILTVSPVKEAWFIGGAGLVALQMANLGATVRFLTPWWEHDQAKRFAAGFEKSPATHLPVAIPNRPIYIKTRYLADNQKLLKVNQGRYAPLSQQDSAQFGAMALHAMNECDAMVICDFGYGLFGSPLVTILAEGAQKAGIPYFLDVSHSGHSNLLKFHHPRLATPTEHELRAAFGDREHGLSNLAARYFKLTGAGNLVLTLGDRGSILFRPAPGEGERLPTDYLPAFNTQPVDAIGAGDVFLAGLVLTDLAGGSTAQGMYLGSCLAALHINQPGNDPNSLLDLIEVLNHRPELTL